MADELDYHVIKDPVHVQDARLTIRHCLQRDHLGLIFRFKGGDSRLTNMDDKVLEKLLG